MSNVFPRLCDGRGVFISVPPPDFKSSVFIPTSLCSLLGSTFIKFSLNYWILCPRYNQTRQCSRTLLARALPLHPTEPHIRLGISLSRSRLQVEFPRGFVLFPVEIRNQCPEWCFQRTLSKSLYRYHRRLTRYYCWGENV